MANLEEDMRLGDLSSDLPEHTGRLESAMPYTLVLFALASFAALVLWIVYAVMAGTSHSNLISIINKVIDPSGVVQLINDEENWILNRYYEELGYEGAVLGFLVIISYACVYGAMKVAHHRK